MSNSSFNTFTELNTDTHPLNAKNQVMVNAINAALTTKGNNQLILQNMQGTDAFSALPDGYKPLGVTVYQNIAYIISGKFDTDGTFISGEIGTFPSPDWAALNPLSPQNPNKFRPLKYEYAALHNFLPGSSHPLSILNKDTSYIYPFNTALLNFRSDRLIEVEIQPSYDDSVNIIFTDDYNPPRLINSRFRLSESGKSAALANRRQNKDTNTYSDVRFGATRLIKRSDIIPDLKFLGVSTGGYHVGGGYRFYFKYTDSDGSLTDIIEESRLVTMAYDDHGAAENENTGKFVSFELTNLDLKFSGIRVYFSYASGVVDTSTLVYEILNVYDITTDSIKINIYGNEDSVLITADTLNLDYSSIGTVKTITQYDDRLLLGNITNNIEEYEIFRLAAKKLRIVEKTEDLLIRDKDNKTGYADPKNIYHKLGYWAGETYEIGIVFILTEGRGNTPAFPVKGLDYYDGGILSYTGNTYDGFNPNSGDPSENCLGVFRTSKSRTMLKDSIPGIAKGISDIVNGDADTTEIKYFYIDVTTLKNNNSIIKNTTGFFFVRKERKKDCIVQGYITNTTQVPIASKIADTGRYDAVTTPFAEWDKNEQVHIESLSGTIGKVNAGTYAVGVTPRKILPAPGRIWETHVDIVDQGAPSNRPVSIQGRVEPAVYYSNTGPQFFAFYAADQLANPALMATYFDGTTKGIMPNNVGINGPVRAWSYLCDHTFTNDTLANGNGILWSGVSVPDPGSNSYNFSFNSGDAITITTVSPGFQQVSMNANVFWDHGIGWGEYNIGGMITFDLHYTVGAEGQPTAISNGKFTKTSGNNDDKLWQISTYWPIPISGTFEPLDPNDPGDQYLNYDFTGNNFKEQRKKLNGNYEEKCDVPHYSDRDRGNFKVKVTTTTAKITVTSPAAAGTIIKKLNLYNFNFTPTKLWRKSTLQYVGQGQQAFSNSQFAITEDRNLYYAIAKNAESNGFTEKWTSGAINTRDADKLLTSNTRFSDYIGITTEDMPGDLHGPLGNDAFHVYSETIFSANGKNYTGTDLGDYTYQVQDIGFNLAALANIYDSTDGVIPRGDIWKNKYNSASLSETYFAITKRHKWADLTSIGTGISIYDGDCYIAHVYKRVMYGLGIEGIPTANDPSLYTDYNQNCGLYARGFVMPIVTENNYNVALRTFDNYSATEKLQYSKNRTFYPVESIDLLRGSRQPESTGYNHGYDWDGSDRGYGSLNDRSPSLNINYSNRVMTSAASVSGNFANGYLDFSGLNFRDYNKQLGQITRLITHNNTVYCIFEQGVGALPINQRTMMSGAEGGVFIDNAQVLAPKMQIISTEYGSNQQFSIIKTDQAIYGCDLKKNKIWRVGGSADSGFSLDLISDFAVQSVLVDFKERILANPTSNYVKANYDRERNHVVFSYFNEEFGVYTTDYLKEDPTKVDPDEVYIDPTMYASEPTYTTDGPDEIKTPFENYIKTPNYIGSLYYNETLQKWISKLSWNPLWMFNIENNLYSFDAVNVLNSSSGINTIWKHFSNTVPYSHFYGKQEKFIFEFVLVDKSTVQKILNNLMIISNRTFPSKISYTLLEDDIDYDSFTKNNHSYEELMKQRHEKAVNINPDPNAAIPTTNWSSSSLVIFNLWFNIDVVYIFVPGISEAESNRLQGGFTTYNNTVYVIGKTYEENGVFYNELLYQNGNIVDTIPAMQIINGVPVPFKLTTVDFGIIKQNMEYIEDHLYVEVGKGTQVVKNLDAWGNVIADRVENMGYIRDKAIKIELTYEGYDYVTIQTIISSFIYSFN